MSEILFLVEEDPQGGFTARSLQPSSSIITEGDTVEELKKNIIDALRCHFEDEKTIPPMIRLHFVKDEIMHYAPAS